MKYVSPALVNHKVYFCERSFEPFLIKIMQVYAVICFKDLGPEYTSPTYYIGSTWGSWYEGHAECAEHGGHMAIIRDIDEFERAYDVIGGTSMCFKKR